MFNTTGTKMYQIIRFWKWGSRKLKKVATLEEAQAHCKDPKTCKKDSNGQTIWFDGYTKIEGAK